MLEFYFKIYLGIRPRAFGFDPFDLNSKFRVGFTISISSTDKLALDQLNPTNIYLNLTQRQLEDIFMTILSLSGSIGFKIKK
jgi:hypothetical protein